MNILFATDLDGTLLDANAKLSAKAASLWKELTEKGIMLTYITARSPATVEPIMQAANPKYPGVVMTGSAIWNPIDKKYDYVSKINTDSSFKIIEICRKHHISPFIYTLPTIPGNKLDVYHENQYLNPLERKFVVDRTINELKEFYIGSPLPESEAKETVLFFALGSPKEIKEIAIEINNCTSCIASWYPDTYNDGIALLEVFAPGVSKAEGLLMLKKRLKADKVIAFGDNLNDIPMLKAADYGIAMGNAQPEVKAIADEIIGDNLSDSAILWIANNSI